MESPCFGVPILRSDGAHKKRRSKSLLPQKHRNEKLRRQPKRSKNTGILETGEESALCELGEESDST